MTLLDWITLFETVTFSVGLVAAFLGAALIMWGIATRPSNLTKESGRQTERFLQTLHTIRRLFETRRQRPA